jgi:peptidoglycan/xylan/chitin deacetylase (PgdA/CDA1 family)
VDRRQLLLALGLGLLAAGTGPAAAQAGTTLRVVRGLPGPGRSIALTVDDGRDAVTVEALARLAAATGVRLTFFGNGIRPGWTQHAALLRPLVDSGQVQLGNHTWSHPHLARLTDRRVAQEIGAQERFLQRTYGVSGRPWFRPP